MTAPLKERTTLEAACAKARDEGLVALDTEFVWIRTYRPKLGIVQFGCRSDSWALDALSSVDPQPLADLVADPSIVKILHDARQDLMHILHYAHVCPCTVFDTQLAAAFAGFPSGIGLQRLLQDVLGVCLPKTETLTDWTRRPLTEAQLEYALDDVRYLADLREALQSRADDLGTRTWMEEDMLRYDEPSLYDEIAPEEAWKRVKVGRHRLDGRGRAVLRAVAAVRENMARDLDVPRLWLGDDASLEAMARSSSVGRIVHRLRKDQFEAVRAAYAVAVSEAAELPETSWPEEPKPYYIADVRQVADEAMAWLGERAAELHVAPSVIANRATVTAYVDNVEDETNPLAAGWRHDVVGREMAERFGVD